MTREEAKRQKAIKNSIFERHRGTGLTTKQQKRDEQARIARLTERFLAAGGEIKRLPSEQARPLRSPAFNPGNVGED